MIAVEPLHGTIEPEHLFPLMQKLPTGLLLCNLDGSFVYANEFLADFLGYSVDELLKLTYWELTPDKYQAKELLQMANLKHNGRYGPYEKEYIHSSGRLIPIRLNGVMTEINGESFIWSMIEEISSEPSVSTNQDEHRRAYTIHTEKMSALQQLVAGIAHEINNPINFIHGNLNYLAEYAEDLLSIAELCQTHKFELPLELRNTLEGVDLPFIVQDLPQLIQSTKNGSERVRNIVYSLRRFSRIDSEGKKEVDVHEGLDDCLMLLQHRFQKSKIQLVQQYGSIPLLECFAGDLNQVFLNILNNAIDAVDGTVNPTIQIKTEVYGKHLCIRIQDNGPGITDNISKMIFNPFFTTKPVGSGTGLGLTISHQIVTDQHKGFLSFQSVPGEGVEFMIQLPFRLEA